jgi:predicted aspartyl protease
MGMSGLWRASLKWLSISAAIYAATMGVSKAAEPWPAECKLKLAAQLPFSIEHGHITVPVLIDDVPRKFLIDTGAFLSTVSQKVAENQGLKTRLIYDGYNISGIGGQRAERYAIADMLTIAHLRANDVRLIVMRNIEEDGTLGPDYLRNFDIEIDFANKILNLFSPHPCSGHAVYWTDQFATLPMNVTPQGHIRVAALLDGRNVETMIDTGSPATLIGARTATEKFDIAPPAADMTLQGSTGGTSTAAAHRFQSLQLGSLIIHEPSLLVTADEAAVRGDDSDLLLGLRELSKFHVYIAYRSKEMYLSPRVPDQSPPVTPSR